MQIWLKQPVFLPEVSSGKGKKGQFLGVGDSNQMVGFEVNLPVRILAKLAFFSDVSVKWGGEQVTWDKNTWNAMKDLV